MNQQIIEEIPQVKSCVCFRSDDKLLGDNGVIIIHRNKKDNLKITSKLNILDIRNYGISKIVIGN